MALTSLKLSHIQLVFKQLVLLYSIRYGYFQPEPAYGSSLCL